jgi:hypothetical protein
MTQDARDHRLLGNGGNDPQRPLMAKRAGGQIEGKHRLCTKSDFCTKKKESAPKAL